MMRRAKEETDGRRWLVVRDWTVGADLALAGAVTWGSRPVPDLDFFSPTQMRWWPVRTLAREASAEPVVPGWSVPSDGSQVVPADRGLGAR